MTFHLDKGTKVIDKPCDCERSREYFSKKEVAKRDTEAKKELERVTIGIKETRAKERAEATKTPEKKTEGKPE